jgi:hypothetical protein
MLAGATDTELTTLASYFFPTKVMVAALGNEGKLNVAGLNVIPATVGTGVTVML